MQLQVFIMKPDIFMWVTVTVIKLSVKLYIVAAHPIKTACIYFLMTVAFNYRWNTAFLLSLPVMFVIQETQDNVFYEAIFIQYLHSY